MLLTHASDPPPAALASNVTSLAKLRSSYGGSSARKDSMGADAATAPWMADGYLIRSHDASMPPYEPPKAMKGDAGAIVSRRCRISVAKSASACVCVMVFK